MIRARQTIYRGIPMRSRLEARAAQTFDSAGFTWEYEPQCFADETGQYLPDFALIGDKIWPRIRDRTMYVEVKPQHQFTDSDLLLQIMRRTEIIWSSEPRAVLVILSPELNEIYARHPGDPWFHLVPWLRESA